MYSKEISVTGERFYSAHHDLRRIAQYNLDKAKSSDQYYFDYAFVAITLSSLSIEAFCNAVGEKIIPSWNDFESSNPLAKTRLICNYLNITYDSSEEPWGSLIWLSKIRNLIAHPKAKEILSNRLMSQQEYEDYDKNLHDNQPKSKLESLITIKNAEKAMLALNEIIKIFCEKLTNEQNIGVEDNMWFSSTKPTN